MEDFANFAHTYDARILDPSIRSMYGGDYYNVGDWGDGRKTLDQSCIALADRHFRHLQPEPGWKVLDIGCGLGATANRLAQAYPDIDVIGANISYSQLSYAKARYPSVDFCLMNAGALAIADESLDGIVSIEAAFHFPSRVEFLREARRTLKPAGRMVFSDIIFNKIKPLGDWWIPEGARRISRSEYQSICIQAGFNVVLIENIADATWKPFSRFLGRHIGDLAYAEQLEESVSAYFLVVLEIGD